MTGINRVTSYIANMKRFTYSLSCQHFSLWAAPITSCTEFYSPMLAMEIPLCRPNSYSRKATDKRAFANLSEASGILEALLHSRAGQPA